MSVNFFKNGTLTKIARGLKDAAVTITNNLLATESGTALDAVQGKVLDDKITEVNNSLKTVSNILSVVEKLADTTSNSDVTVTLTDKKLSDYKLLLLDFNFYTNITAPQIFENSLKFRVAYESYDATVTYISDTQFKIRQGTTNTNIHAILYGIK